MSVNLTQEEISLIAKYIDFIDKDLSYFLDMIYSHGSYNDFSGYHTLDLVKDYLLECSVQVPENYTPTYYYDGSEDTRCPEDATLAKCYYGIKTIQDCIFEDCIGIKSFTIPKSVTSIGFKSFCNCGITSIDIPDSVTFIDDFAFSSCHSLTTVKLSKNIVEMPMGCFANSKLIDIHIPDGVKTLKYGVFRDCKNLENVFIPQSVNDIVSVKALFKGCDSPKLTVHTSNQYVVDELERNFQGIKITN